ncbi:hypothetical protein HYV70_02925 [Candidatus Uhrbacteria bacterium]|nr:hypothetical protein [Candidatus Uhrbacteria bacterium]
MMYFILGSHPLLSLSELKAVLGTDFHPVFQSSAILLNKNASQNPAMLQERLAGVIKIGRIVSSVETWDVQKITDLITSLLTTVEGKNKISFGLSLYNLDDPQKTKGLEKQLDALGLTIKKQLKQKERPVRYVKGKEPRLSSAIVETNGLLTSGGEFALFVSKRGIFIGQTSSIQPFKAWSKRDFGRPRRDAKNGMLPPKLARMMINLSGVNPTDSTILDPFCGSGTVLMEATLMGFKEIIGGDIWQKAMDDTRMNMDWLIEEFQLSQPKMSLYTTSAADLPKVYSNPVDTIVTEVFLGNPRTRTINTQEGQRLEQELIPLFHSSFSALKRVLKPSGKAVVAFPAFKQKDDSWYRLPLHDLLTSLGYTILEQHLYFRPNQFVARDIVVLTS